MCCGIKPLKAIKIKGKLQAWREICIIINDGFESLSDVEKNKFGKYV